MVHCVAYGCNQKSDDGTKGFFLFPKDHVYRKKWIEAVGSNRERDGKVVPFVPTATSRLCIRHFEDSCFLHPPSVMVSIGVQMKLNLLKTAVPTIFAENVEYKKKTLPSPEKFGPPKSRRKLYGAYEKRDRKRTLDELLEKHDSQQAEAASEERHLIEEQLRMEELFQQGRKHESHTPLNYQIGLDFQHASSDHMSRGSQTTESFLHRPTVNKASQVKPQQREVGMTALPEMKSVACGPDELSYLVDKSFQFPDPDDHPVVEEETFFDADECGDLVDSNETDADWEPDGGDADMDYEEEEQACDETLEEEVNTLKEAKYIVYESCLRQLLLLCFVCGSTCHVIKKKLMGTMVMLEAVCEHGHSKLWSSQPLIRNTPTMNLLMSGAIMFSGASPSKVLNIFKFLNLQMVAGRTYARFQKSFVLPAISNVWERTQREILRECRGRPIKVGGDARCCSPGHSAKYGSYTIMDLQTGLVLAVELVQSNEVKNSNAMELEGLKRALRRIDDSGVSITDITTDRHMQVKRYLREEQKTINHWFDGWHLAKNMKKQLCSLGKKKGCEIISQWTQSISNHLYYCAASSGGDGDAVEHKWMSIVNHVTNKHEGHGEKFPNCLHGPIERNWIKAGSKAHKELELLISKRRLLNDIRKLSPAEQTSQLEAQHKVVCQFAPKFVSFSYPGMKQRLHLAALHTCCNADRVQAVNNDGQLRFKLSYPKHKAGHHVLKLVKEDCSYEYVATLLDELIILRQKYNSHKEAQEESSRHLQSPPPLTSTANKVLKEDAITMHRSRFCSQKSLAYSNPLQLSEGNLVLMAFTVHAGSTRLSYLASLCHIQRARRR